MARKASIYTIQVSNHPGAAERIPTEDAAKSWKTVYDGKIGSPKDARKATEELSQWYRSVRTFKGGTIGKLWYAVLRHT